MAGSNSQRMTEFEAELSRLRRRAATQKRAIATGPDAWQRWSGTMDVIGSLIDQMVGSPAPDIASLAAKFDAILWQVEANDSLLHRGDPHRLRRAASLRLLANGN